jgi:hypothetical protein
MTNDNEFVTCPKSHQSVAMTSLLPFLGPFLLVEIAAAAALVVGLFKTASQPFGWGTALQFLACCAVGALLWIADRHLNAGDESAATGA